MSHFLIEEWDQDERNVLAECVARGDWNHEHEGLAHAYFASDDPTLKLFGMRSKEADKLQWQSENASLATLSFEQYGAVVGPEASQPG